MQSKWAVLEIQFSKLSRMDWVCGMRQNTMCPIAQYA